MIGRRQVLWALAGLPLTLTACGRRGSLKAPKGAEGAYSYPSAYPVPESVVPQSAPETEARDAEAAPAEEDRPLSPLPPSPRRSKPYGS